MSSSCLAICPSLHPHHYVSLSIVASSEITKKEKKNIRIWTIEGVEKKKKIKIIPFLFSILFTEILEPKPFSFWYCFLGKSFLFFFQGEKLDKEQKETLQENNRVICI